MSKYQYILSYNGSDETLTVNPAGWDSIGLTMLRHEVYHSVLRSYTLSLRFANKTGGGYDFIKDAFDTEGVFAEVSIQIKRRNPDTYAFDSLYVGVLDFTPGKLVIERDFIEVPIIDSSKLQKFISRDENEVNLLASATLDGDSITPLTPSTITLTPVDIILKAEANCDCNGTHHITSSGDTYHYPDNNTFVTNMIGDVVTIDGTGLIYENQGTKSVSLKVEYHDHMAITGALTAENPFDSASVNLYYAAYWYNSSDVLQDTLILADRGTSLSDPGESPKNIAFLSKTITVSEVWTLQPGDYIEVSMKITVVCYNGGYCDIEQNSTVNLKLTEFNGGYGQTPANCVFPFTAFERALYLLTGLDEQLTSTVMDTGGALQYDAILNGFQIREYPSPKLNVTFRSLFKSFDAVYSIGLGYDNTTSKFVIEEKSFFFDSSTFLFELSDVKEFQRKSLTTAYFSKITGGFENTGSYERVQGALEFAVRREYSTKSIVKEEKNIQSPYRFDSVGIEELRNLPYVSYASEDNDSDNDVFIVRTNGTTPVLPTVGSPEYDGMEVFYSYYNTMYTPRQNTIRWGGILAACHYLKSSPNEYQAQKTDKQFTLAVDGTDENSDITLAEMGTALFIPELYIFESYLTPDNIDTLLTSPNGYIRFIFDNTTYEGYIQKVELGDYNRKASFELIAKTLSSDDFTYEDGDSYVFEDTDQKQFE